MKNYKKLFTILFLMTLLSCKTTPALAQLSSNQQLDLYCADNQNNSMYIKSASGADLNIQIGSDLFYAYYDDIQNNQIPASNYTVSYTEGVVSSLRGQLWLTLQMSFPLQAIASLNLDGIQTEYKCESVKTAVMPPPPQVIESQTTIGQRVIYRCQDAAVFSIVYFTRGQTIYDPEEGTEAKIEANAQQAVRWAYFVIDILGEKTLNFRQPDVGSMAFTSVGITTRAYINGTWKTDQFTGCTAITEVSGVLVSN